MTTAPGDPLGLIKQALEECAQQIRINMQAKGLNASGKTSKSIRVEMYEDGGRITARAYFGTVEDGRKPGKTPTDIVAILEAWITAKGINVIQVPYKREPSARWTPKYTVQQRSIKMAASAIAHSIRKSGTQLYRKGGDKTVYTPEIDRAIDTLTKRIANILVEQYEF